MSAPYPLAVQPTQLRALGVLLTCTRCGWLIDVIDIPRVDRDPDRYVCGACLVPVVEEMGA